MVVLGIVGTIDSKYGRELLETDDNEIVIAFGALFIILILHLVLDIIFVYLYYIRVVKKDYDHR